MRNPLNSAKTLANDHPFIFQLAKDLQKSFPGMRGLSSRNLWNMLDFYASYQGNEKLQSMTAEISWTHNVETVA